MVPVGQGPKCRLGQQIPVLKHSSIFAGWSSNEATTLNLGRSAKGGQLRMTLNTGVIIP